MVKGRDNDITPYFGPADVLYTFLILSTLLLYFLFDCSGPLVNVNPPLIFSSQFISK